MSSFIKNVRDSLLNLAQNKVSEKLDGRAITRNLDKELDLRLGENISEKIQRGLLADTLFEMLEGLYWENLHDLSQELVTRAGKIEGGI